MLLSKLQFECVLQPDGLWTVWDTVTDVPAMIDADELIVPDEDEALDLCRRLNAGAGTEARRAA